MSLNHSYTQYFLMTFTPILFLSYLYLFILFYILHGHYIYILFHKVKEGTVDDAHGYMLTTTM